MNYKVEKMETPWGFDSLFGGKDNAGSGILHTTDKSGEVRAQAIVSPELMLSKIAQGFDEGYAGSLKGNAKPLVTAICLSYLSRDKAACEDELEKAKLQTQINQLKKAGGRVDVVDTYFKNTLRNNGAHGVKELAKLIETVELKCRTLTVREKNFIQALEKAAMKAKGVPYQKDVKVEWLVMDLENAKEETFHTLKRRLGFGWLPAGTRGKKVFRSEP